MGGGNVAIDVARTARLGRPPDVVPLGDAEAGDDALPSPARGALRGAVAGEAHDVHVVARQQMGEWPAQRGVHGGQEIEAALAEGVVFHPLRGIRRILGEGGRVTAVELAEVVRLTDEGGRYAPLYGDHAAETIPCDTVLLAVGQEPDLDYLAGTAAVERTRDGLVRTDPETLATTLPGVYAGGDAAFGPRTLIQAIAEGKRAARSIHERLAGGAPPPRTHLFTEVHPRSARLAEAWDTTPREEPPVVELARRTGIARVDGVYDEAAARTQASRCLSCHVQTVYDGALCVACGRCTDVCPHACLSLVPEADVEVGGRAVVDGAPGRAAMLKDEDLCVRCGLCAERCPTGAMTLERYEVRVGAVAS
jgi:NADPH-dependent glutamate synthase beta subunit-like oxidoreductase